VDYVRCLHSTSSRKGCFTLRSSKSLIQGTRGSPVMGICDFHNEKQLCVTGMYQQTFPSFNDDENIPFEYIFEAGITSKRIAEILDQYSQIPNIRCLRRNIFLEANNKG